MALSREEADVDSYLDRPKAAKSLPTAFAAGR